MLWKTRKTRNSANMVIESALSRSRRRMRSSGRSRQAHAVCITLRKLPGNLQPRARRAWHHAWTSTPTLTELTMTTRHQRPSDGARRWVDEHGREIEESDRDPAPAGPTAPARWGGRGRPARGAGGGGGNTTAPPRGGAPPRATPGGG